MSLQTILERIRATGQIQVQEIQAQSEREVQACMNEAQFESERLFQAAYTLALEPEAGERAHALNQARFESMCTIGKARESLIDEVLSEATQQLEDIRDCPEEYAPALRKILLEILPGQDGMRSLDDRMILEADPRDQILLERILEENGLAMRVEYVLHCWGGLIARSPDGTIRIINTLESRMERVLPFLRQRLITWFDQGQAINEPQQPGQMMRLVD